MKQLECPGTTRKEILKQGKQQLADTYPHVVQIAKIDSRFQVATNILTLWNDGKTTMIHDSEPK